MIQVRFDNTNKKTLNIYKIKSHAITGLIVYQIWRYQNRNL